MKLLDICSDDYGRLVLKQYALLNNSPNNTENNSVTREFNTSTFEGQVYDEEVEKYLEQLSKSNNIIETEFDEKEKQVLINYNDFIVKIHNLSTIRNDRKRYLDPFFSKIQKSLEDKSIEKIKKNNTKKPKVTRNNKHANAKISKKALAIVLALMVTAYIINQSQPTKESPVIDEPITSDKPSTIDKGPSDIPCEPIIPTVFIECKDSSNTDKAINARNMYGDIIKKYSDRYGLDANLILGIATQERGEHSSIQDPGGATGLMQIQNGVWLGNEISAYNFETGEKEKFIVTKEMIENVDTNIQIGCMYFQNCLEYCDYDILRAVQTYNFGKGNMDSVIDYYTNERGISKKEALSSPINTDWMDYIEIVEVGDPNYINNVFSWMNDENLIRVKTRDNFYVELNVNRATKEKVY